jgi:hypothetical protein
MTREKTSVVNSDPEFGAFLSPGSGFRDKVFPVLGFRIPNPYFCELSDSFLTKCTTIILCYCHWAQILHLFKNKNVSIL